MDSPLNPHFRFFKNKGAVAGVFLIVGLAAATIVIWLIFAVSRRRKRRRLEQEASLAAPAGHRSPLEDEDEEDKVGMGQANNTLPVTAARPPSAYFDEYGSARHADGAYDPYVGYSHPQPAGLGAAVAGGYIPARTSSPPPASPHPSTLSYGHNRPPSGSNSADTGQHSRNLSFSSYEPLLSAAGINNKTPPSTPGPLSTAKAPTPPPRNPLRPTASRSSEDRKADDRLDPAMATRLSRADTTASGIRDDQDYSRPVLGVRNSYTIIVRLTHPLSNRCGMALLTASANILCTKTNRVLWTLTALDTSSFFQLFRHGCSARSRLSNIYCAIFLFLSRFCRLFALLCFSSLFPGIVRT